MGKRSSSFLASIDANTELAQEAQQKTAQIADALSDAAQVTSPVEQLREAVPQAAPIVRTGVEDVGPGLNPENLGREDLQVTTGVQPTAETMARVQRANIPNVQNIGIEPSTQGMLSPEAAGAALTEQLEDELVIRGGALAGSQLESFIENVDPNFDFKDDDDGMLLLRNMLDAASKSVRTDAGQTTLFGKKIDLSNVPKEEVAGDPDGVIRRNADMFNGIIKSDRKLNMLEDPSDPNSEVRPEFGRAALLAVLIEVGNRLQAQQKEVDEVDNDRRFDQALDRINIGKAIGQRTVRLLRPSANEDPKTMLSGESSGFGYDYGNINEEELSVLGQTLIQGFAASPQFSWIQPYMLERDGQKKASFRTTREGEAEIARIRRAARRSLGMADKDRPVSLVPLIEGRLVGQAAETQKKITAQVKKNYLSDSAAEAINELGQVAHTVSPHKVLLAQGWLNSTTQDPTNIFAKYTKQDKAYADKKYNEILREYTAKAEREGLTPQELGFMSFEEAALDATTRIQQNHRFERQDTILDGIARMNNAFYYGYTAINNSERLMITQTELNYQADKTARFLVDGAIPAKFKKGSNSNTEQGFFKVLARSLVPEAGSMSSTNQTINFEMNREKYTKWGMQLLNYTRQNEARLNTAKQDNLKDLPPLSLSPDLQEYLAEMGKDEFYFAMDALHELARYEMADANADFASRVKGEIDGNSNGAVIQAAQMGVKGILEKGGVLYQDNAELEDIRVFVFDQLETYPDFAKEMDMAPVFKAIRNNGKIKELLKVPVMTSIYGKDPSMHRDTAKKFYDDNTDLFSNIQLHPDPDRNRTLIIDQLRDSIGFGLEQGLSGALEHAKMAKRIGRIFNIANEIAEIEGANGFSVQAGGFEFTPFSKTEVEFGEEANQRGATITTFQRTPSALAEASGKKIGPGQKNTPDMGSKLRNQLAVNATQNIDATIAQRTVTKVIKDTRRKSNVMQVYDAFMGDANSFSQLEKVANETFYDVNFGKAGYNMLEKERDALNALKNKVKAKVQEKKASNGMFDIGKAGEHRGLGNLLAKAVGKNSIIIRDMPDGSAKNRALTGDRGDRTTGRGIANFARLPGIPGVKTLDKSQAWDAEADEVLITPEKFQMLFNYALNMLNVENDLNTMITETNKRRNALANEVKRDKIRQYS